MKTFTGSVSASLRQSATMDQGRSAVKKVVVTYDAATASTGDYDKGVKSWGCIG